MTCPICSNVVMRAEIDVCPICGAPGAKPELDALAAQWFEEYRDREEDERVFGTPKPKGADSVTKANRRFLKTCR